MILQIDTLMIPNTLSGNAEMFNADSRRRTVSGRLITKMSTFEKWRATLFYEGRAIPQDFMKELYRKCREMRRTALPVTFISPYDFMTYTVMMRCTEPFPPKLMHIVNSRPQFYSNCGAVFEEV